MQQFKFQKIFPSNLRIKNTMNCTLKLILTLITLSLCIEASKAAAPHCNSSQATSLSALEACNDQQSSCRAFLIFTAKSPYVTVPAIANLTSSDQSEISRINRVEVSGALPEGQEIIVPVNCSCSGRSYETSTTYEILPGETYFIIANEAFQGLSTCYALKHANIYPETMLLPGQKLRVPLRCACPDGKQAALGTKFLLTYSVGHGDTLLALSKRFNVSALSMFEANRFSDEFVEIQPSTTILIPLKNEPSHLQALSGEDNVSIPPLPPVIAPKRRSSRVRLVVGFAAGAFFLLILLLVGVLFISYKKRASISESRRGNAKVFSPRDLILEIAKLDRGLEAYRFSEIKRATRNFGSRSRIRDSEYRGTFKREVLAVKKSGGNTEHEIKMMYKINHFNIVRLHGFCQERDDSYLVYEYMANGSLRDWMDRREAAQELKSWSQRIRIALDVANGLLYLHSFANPAYVHNDVTSSNILLDTNLRAKLANFSLAREANCSTIERVVGSKGYMAPECLEAGPLTPKVDVYAFGVVLLELITEKLPVFEEDGRGRLLSTTIAALMESPNAESELCSFIGPGLAENGSIKYAIQVVKLGLSCLVQDPSDRPDMVEVVSVLLKMQSVIHKPL